ncbi:Uncharacterised protein [Candidatus Bilamarchaeum dharawalense]|uniref:Uncharacterized protein n=1 Tax=Candidatus Bilamarchaeum dharawalense TaxID=2885759 RepID=A0A5E4LRI8_9ARCH|nr:Uncharacterised protein [Candidatus Bilamarchaeum dharawalense]
MVDSKLEADLEKTFQTITSVVLGKKLGNFRDYEKWLTENVSTNEYGESVMSREKIYLPPFDFYRDIKHNILTIEEGYDIQGKKQLSPADLEQLNLSNAKNTLQKLSTVTPNTKYGECSNLIDCDFYYSSHYCYKSVAMVRSKYCYYCFWPRQSDYSIGTFYTFSSQFCIKCYNSENLNRCFEMSDCTNCTDSLFCHNCENLNNCMFCFNVKAKRYAICNVEVGRDRYMEIKQMVLGYIHKELEQTKGLKLNIFNVGQ